MSDDSTKNDEESLFMAEMVGVTPIKSANKVVLKKKVIKPQRNLIENEYSLAIDDVFSTAEVIEECPEVLSFSRSGLQHKVLKTLRQGKNPIEHALDLHGLTVEHA